MGECDHSCCGKYHLAKPFCIRAAASRAPSFPFRTCAFTDQSSLSILGKPRFMISALRRKVESQVVRPQVARLKAMDPNVKLAQLHSATRNDD